MIPRNPGGGDEIPQTQYPSVILMGFNEAGALRGGWHDLERDGRQGVPYRATKAEAHVRIGRPPDATRLSILLSGSPSLLGRPLAGTIEVRELKTEIHPEKESGMPTKKPAVPVRLTRDVWVVRDLDLSGMRSAAVQVRVKMDDLVIPDRVLRNGDARELGFYISALWCS